MVAEIVMNHSAMILMMPACSSNILTKVFLQTKVVAVLQGRRGSAAKKR